VVSPLLWVIEFVHALFILHLKTSAACVYPDAMLFRQVQQPRP
jgi:hypothetical protein